MCSELKFCKTHFFVFVPIHIKILNNQQTTEQLLIYWKHVNTRSSYCVSVVGVYKMWWGWVGTLSDFATLLGHSTAKRLPTPDLAHLVVHVNFSRVSRYGDQQGNRKSSDIMAYISYICIHHCPWCITNQYSGTSVHELNSFLEAVHEPKCS
jgi:hypothetical protein